MKDAKLIRPFPAAYRQCTVYLIKEDKTETIYCVVNAGTYIVLYSQSAIQVCMPVPYMDSVVQVRQHLLCGRDIRLLSDWQ